MCTIFATAKIQSVDFWVMKLCIRYSSGPSFATVSKLRARHPLHASLVFPQLLQAQS